MRELMERHPMVAVNEGDQLADLHYVRRGQSDKGQHDRRDSNLSNDPEGVQIETIMLDHENPEEMFSLQSVYLTTWNEKDHFTVFSAIATFVCIVSYVINIGTDVAVCYLLFMENNLWWFGFTATTTVVPVLTVNVFSIRWYLQDAQEKKLTSRTLSKPNLSKLDWTVRIFFHVLLLGPVIRYVDLLKYGLRSRQFNKQKQRRKFEWHFNVGHKPPIRVEQLNDVNYHHLMIEEDRDTAFLALLESFMESAPQLVLQIYILAERESPASFLTVCLQVASVASSLFELSWALAFYQRALRRSVLDKKNMTRTGTAIQFLWRFCTIGARVFALALFASEYKLWTIPVCVGHWGVMTVWIMHQRTHFCDDETGKRGHCEEYLFNMVIGVVYIFCFLNVKDGPTRYKVTLYYTIVFMENFILIVLWYVHTDPTLWYHLPAFIGIFTSSLMGVSIMAIYYCFCHPNGKLPQKDRQARCC